MNRLFIVGILAVSGAWQVEAQSQALEEIAIQPDQIDNLGIKTVALESAGAVRGVRLPAQVVIPPSQVNVVSAPQTGLVQSLQVAAGEEVHIGQELARIQSPDLLALQRDFLQVLTQLHLARTELERDQNLYKEGIIAERRLLEKRSRYAELAAARDERRQALELAGMSTAAIRSLSSSRTLTSTLGVQAPMDGVVMEVMVNTGERVEFTEPLFRLADLEPLWLEIRAPLDDVESLEIGAEVEVDGCPARARLFLIGREVDSDSQTVLLRAEVYTGSDALRPGQFVRVRLAGSSEPGYSVPSSALVRSADRVVVFVRRPSGFSVVPVEVVNAHGAQAVIRGEFRGDEQVAVQGVVALKAMWLGGGE